MLKLFVTSLFIIIFISCANFSYPASCIDNSTYHLIDTTAFYSFVKTYDSNLDNRIIMLNHKNSGLKFYKNGKVIEYTDYPSTKNAEGKYCINKKKAVVKIFYRHVQGNFWSTTTLQFKKDTIISRTQPSPQTRRMVSTYLI